MMEYLNVDAIIVAGLIVAGLMVGSELAIAAFVHPTLDRLADNVHLPVAAPCWLACRGDSCRF
jgi:hypothetical protein